MSDSQFEARLSLALLALFLFFICFALDGCSADNPYVDAWNEGVANAESKLAENELYQDRFVNEYFEKVGSDSKYSFHLYRDLRTDVMYVCFNATRGSGLSVLYAADGTPLLYPEWLALEADQEGGDGNE